MAGRVSTAVPTKEGHHETGPAAWSAALASAQVRRSSARGTGLPDVVGRVLRISRNLLSC